jgi:hypothetical protein
MGTAVELATRPYTGQPPRHRAAASADGSAWCGPAAPKAAGQRRPPVTPQACLRHDSGVAFAPPWRTPPPSVVPGGEAWIACGF